MTSLSPQVHCLNFNDYFLISKTIRGVFSAGTLWKMSVTCTCRQQCQPTRAGILAVRTSQPTPHATTTNTRVRTMTLTDSVTAIGPADSTPAKRVALSAACTTEGGEWTRSS